MSVAGFPSRDLTPTRYIGDAFVCLCVLFVFLKNAWVTEDAFITFRSLEQLSAGHGPVWNVGERVQVYSSPLWFWLLAVGRVLIGNEYEMVLVVSGVLTVGLLWQMHRLAEGHRALWMLMVLMLVASSAFFDFTSSGLENPLSYVLMAGFVLDFRQLWSSDGAVKQWSGVLAWTVLLVLCRIDLVTLIVPSLLVVLMRHRRVMMHGQWLGLALRWMLPLVCWFGFAWVYYGDPLPNTAYAKLNTGIAQPLLWAQGVEYLKHTLRYDPITMVVTLGVPVLAFRMGGAPRALSVGVWLNLIYVVAVGGDFMQGRFVSVAYLLAVLVLGLALQHAGLTAASGGRRAIMVLTAAAAVTSLAVPTSPLRTGRDFHDATIHSNGIANERGYFFQLSSLDHYVSSGRRTTCFVDVDWGPRLGADGQRVLVDGYIGYFGRCAVPLDRMVIDPHALSDPFLARIPLEPGTSWRIGHFKRTLPEGYVESMETGENRIRDPRLRRLLDEVWLKTRAPLLSARRLRALLGLSPSRSLRDDADGGDRGDAH